MITRYDGVLTEQAVLEYLDLLKGKVFKLLPIYETNKRDYIRNHNKLMNELIGGESLVLYCGFYIELLNKLEGIKDVTEHEILRCTVLECIDLVDKLKGKVRGWGFGQDSQ